MSQDNGKIEPPSVAENIWQGVFFAFSALIAARAMVDFSNGALPSALGNVGVTLLMLSMIYRLPFLRAFVEASSSSGADPQKQRAALLQQAEKMRNANPWPSRLARVGWALFFASVLLRFGGVE